MLVRALYVSTPPPGLTRETLEEHIAPIRLHALTFNAIRGLTGAFAYSEHCFAQAIEGPDDEVEALLGRIGCDKRHSDFRIVDRRPITNRAFADWAMAFAPAPGFSAHDLPAGELVRFLIAAAQRCGQVRAIPGHPRAIPTQIGSV